MKDSKHFLLSELESNKLSQCPSCDSHNIVPFLSIHHIQQLVYHFCDHCGVIFQNPTLTEESWEKFYKKLYRKLYNANEEPTDAVLNRQQQRAETYIELFKTFGIQFSSHLDIGSSSGILIQKIKEAYQVEYQAGVEPGEKYNTFATQKGFEIFDSLEEVLARQKKFDLITVCHVLEHITKPAIFLEKVRSLLSDSGVLFLEVPNAEGNIFSMEFAHPLVFSTRSLRTLLQKSGFHVQEIIIHGKPTYADNRCKNYMAVFALKSTRDKNVSEVYSRWQLRKKMLRNTYWFENNISYLLKSPYRYYKLLFGKYAK